MLAFFHLDVRPGHHLLLTLRACLASPLRPIASDAGRPWESVVDLAAQCPLSFQAAAVSFVPRAGRPPGMEALCVQLRHTTGEMPELSRLKKLRRPAKRKSFRHVTKGCGLCTVSKGRRRSLFG